MSRIAIDLTMRMDEARKRDAATSPEGRRKAINAGFDHRLQTFAQILERTAQYGGFSAHVAHVVRKAKG